MESKKDVYKIIREAKAKSIQNVDGAPYIVLDGILNTAHNTLVDIAIGRAAHEVLGLNVGYLCFNKNENHYSHRLFQEAGATAFELSSCSGNLSIRHKITSRLKGYLSSAGKREDILNLNVEGIPIGDLVYDGIIRQNDQVYTASDASFETIRVAIERGIRKEREVRPMFEEEDIEFLVLSHKVYPQYGIPARVATDTGTTLISKARAHLNRVSSLKGHIRNDTLLSLEKMDKVIERFGAEQLRSYARERFEGATAGADVQFAFAEKKTYDAPEIRSRLSAGDMPLALIAPHAFSDAPHCDRKMAYSDYYQWFTRLLSLTEKLGSVRWAVKPHPSSSLYNEDGVVEKLVDQHDHVQLVPSDARTDSILRAADAVLTGRGTIGMEALLFNCQVILAGNAIYDSIDCVNVNLSEESLYEALQSISRKKGVPQKDKHRALAALYYRDKSTSYTSPLFGPERPPGLCAEKAYKHDRKNIERWADYLETHSYEDDPYYQKLIDFFRSGADRLSILNLAQ